MQYHEQTPRVETTIAAQTYTVPQPYAEGHTLTENEAAALNQLLRENVRNNVAARIKTATEKGEPVPTQADVDAYVTEYEFGVRRGGGTTRAPVDPVEREMHNIARDKIKAALKANGVALKDVPAADMNAKIESVVAANEQALRAMAKKVLKQREAIAAETIVVPSE